MMRRIILIGGIAFLISIIVLSVAVNKLYNSSDELLKTVVVKYHHVKKVIREADQDSTKIN